ncbi:hypothetical protein [Aquabacterium humicola]|uniref:hypothetical protein n=1 Tax=Aquabacterium humicola TaxID=3237377 RepID=UPI002542F0D7|nr:hypothetical protein [Rubrivivax pictus]
MRAVIMTTEPGHAGKAEREGNSSWPEQDDLGAIFPLCGSNLAGAITLICMALAFTMF